MPGGAKLLHAQVVVTRYMIALIARAAPRDLYLRTILFEPGTASAGQAVHHLQLVKHHAVACVLLRYREIFCFSACPTCFGVFFYKLDPAARASARCRAAS